MHMNHMHSADMNDATQTATDPVCGMTVAVNNDAITREHDGTTYYFCGEHCANNFMKHRSCSWKTDRPVKLPGLKTDRTVGRKSFRRVLPAL